MSGRQRDIEEFLSPIPRKTYDPFAMKGMREAVDLVLQHIEDGKKICIYGDYDADGVTSVSLLYEFLSNLTRNVIYYIPSRFSEGYGLNLSAIDEIHRRGADLIVTVDWLCLLPGSGAYQRAGDESHRDRPPTMWTAEARIASC